MFELYKNQESHQKQSPADKVFEALNQLEQFKKESVDFLSEKPGNTLS